MAKIWPSKLLQATLVGKDGKSAEQPKLGIHDHFKPLWWEKNEEKNGKIKIRHSQSFLTILVVKDRKKCEITKIEHSKSFRPISWKKMGKSAK